jgi:spore coat protein U-like protein
MMRFRLPVMAALLAFLGSGQAGGLHTIEVSGTVISKHNCKFQSATSALNFGTIDPLGLADAVASVVIGFRCNGNPNTTLAYSISHNGGQNFAVGAPGPKMMRQTAPADLLPYSLSLSPTNGVGASNTNLTLTVTGTIQALHYQSARPGSYADSVVLSILP